MLSSFDEFRYSKWEHAQQKGGVSWNTSYSN